VINVTKSFLPPIEEYTKYLERIWQSGHLTNHGPLVNELEQKLKDFLQVKHLFYVNNGTIALQIAIKALEIKGEVITTPFSYVATTSSLVWENCTPVFADIDPSDFTIDEARIEEAITPRTTAILATHVYGIPCHVEAIRRIAEKHKLKVIYDAAHAFGVRYKDASILNHGDVSTLSFHATKLFHTVEGGAIVTNDDDLAHRIGYMRNFGHKGQEEFWGLGINGKSSEFHAAMGLCMLPRIEKIMEARKKAHQIYSARLSGLGLQTGSESAGVEWNFSYYPIVFDSQKTLLAVKDALNALYIYPRRYFFPSLSTLNYVSPGNTPNAADISCRILCLPLYFDLAEEDIARICDTIRDIIRYSKHAH
jgi:dTDP-4-amino-4,6-dideoxygalactose transaminase